MDTDSAHDCCVSVYAVAIGERLGMSLPRLRALRRAATASTPTPRGLVREILRVARAAAEVEEAKAYFSDPSHASAYDPRVVEALRHVAPLISPVRR